MKQFSGTSVEDYYLIPKHKTWVLKLSLVLITHSGASGFPAPPVIQAGSVTEKKKIPHLVLNVLIKQA